MCVLTCESDRDRETGRQTDRNRDSKETERDGDREVTFITHTSVTSYNSLAY